MQRLESRLRDATERHASMEASMAAALDRLQQRIDSSMAPPPDLMAAVADAPGLIEAVSARCNALEAAMADVAR